MDHIVLLFPGQGSQYIGMGKDLYNQSSVVRHVFEEASDSLHMDIKKLCFESSTDELTKTENAQAAILTTSYAAFSVFMEEGIEPDFLAGHSLGEITALTCAGGIRFSDAVKIVKLRGKFMQEAVVVGEGCMTAVEGLDTKTVESECNRCSTNGYVVSIAAYNSESQIVISGHTCAVAAVEERLKKFGAVLTRLNVTAPFHCSLMEPAAKRLINELGQYEFNKLKYPVLSNVSGKPYGGCEDIVTNLTNQMIKPVRWQQIMEYLHNQGARLAIEMSPKSVLTNLSKKSRDDFQSYSYEKDQEAIKNVLFQIKQKKGRINVPTVLTKCMAVAVSTKNSNWNNEEYQKGVIEPYNRIQQMQDKLDEMGSKPSREQMLEALSMLKSVFITKKTPVEEQMELIHQILEETGTIYLLDDFKMP